MFVRNRFRHPAAPAVFPEPSKQRPQFAVVPIEMLRFSSRQVPALFAPLGLISDMALPPDPVAPLIMRLRMIGRYAPNERTPRSGSDSTKCLRMIDFAACAPTAPTISMFLVNVAN